MQKSYQNSDRTSINQVNEYSFSRKNISTPLIENSNNINDNDNNNNLNTNSNYVNYQYESNNMNTNFNNNLNINSEKNNGINNGNNNNLNLSGDGLSDSEFQLSQMSNITDRTKFLVKKTMDEYPPTEDDNFFNSLNSEKK